MLHIFPMWCVNRHYLVTTDCRNMQSVVLPADEQHSDVDEGNGKKKKKKMFGYHSDGCSTLEGRRRRFILSAVKNVYGRRPVLPLVSSAVKGRAVARLQCRCVYLSPLLLCMPFVMFQ